MRQHTTGLLIVILLAAIGWGMLTLPPEILARYKEAKELDPNWGYLYLAIIGVGAAILLTLLIAIVYRLWKNTRSKRNESDRRGKNPSELSAGEQRTELQHNLATSRELADDRGVTPDLREAIRQDIEQVEQRLAGDKLEIVAFGTISSGKSSLLNALAGRELFRSDVRGGTTTQRAEVPWPGNDRVTLVDTPGLAEVEGEERAAKAARFAEGADLVLFVVDGPLKAYEVQLIDRLAAMEKRIVICLNKEDWYEPKDLAELLGQIASQTGKRITRDDVVAIRARPASRRRVRVLADGAEVEEQAEVDPDIRPLAERLMAVVDRDGASLLLANLLLQSRGLVDESKNRVRASLDKQADAIINRYMWAAGGVAAVNPIPLLDLAGGTVVAGKMAMELARVYRQAITADALTQILAQLTKNLVGMLGATAATPALATLVGSLLKTAPGVGTIAGGIVQGLVQAMLTRWIGSVLKQYFRDGMTEANAGLAEIAKQKWGEATQPAELLKLIQAGRKQLGAALQGVSSDNASSKNSNTTP